MDKINQRKIGRVTNAGLQVDSELATFLESEVLAPLGLEAQLFWRGFADLLAKHVPANRDLLVMRDNLQTKIDAWHKARAGQPLDMAEYKAFLFKIGYLVSEPSAFEIGTENVDEEIATLAGPQLVVPVLNARFVLNAANARWGSLYDAFYGTDVLADAPETSSTGYNPARGAAVIAAGRSFMADTLPGWEAALTGGYCPYPYAKLTGGAKGVMFEHNGLHIEVHVDRDHHVGATDELGISDIVLESALTSIVDMEDSVAAVDAEDKRAAYANWLGLMRGTLDASFEKGGQTWTRTLEPDRTYERTDGTNFDLPGRSLLLVRNVGHLMTNPAILLSDGSEIPEGIMDAVITCAIGCHDLAGLGRYCNSRAGSIYIVKPKMHGPEEVAFTNALFNDVEDLLGLKRYTIKVGLMDEERRTSANLSSCIETVKDRIVFINTGFLDRTGDEIHTSMQAGPMIRKGAMKGSDWIDAYEKRNVAIGLKHGFSGKAQIGKGMWAAPDRMRQMLVEKIGHPKTGANTAWVPSPTAATLHALHYHQIDVFAQRERMAEEDIPALDRLLTLPLAQGVRWSDEELREELDNNAQGLLGYVVRWVDQGVGCSKVPDISDIGLMEDRATLRISSQHIANWLLHGVVSDEQVMEALNRMAAKVDAQNAGDPNYIPLVGNDGGPAFQAAKDLVFKGAGQPSGYTEPLLHNWRQVKKAHG